MLMVVCQKNDDHIITKSFMKHVKSLYVDVIGFVRYNIIGFVVKILHKKVNGLQNIKTPALKTQIIKINYYFNY
jgi:hypothetical protein